VIASANPVPSLAVSVFPSALAEFLKNDRLLLSSDTYPSLGYRHTNLVPLFNAIDVDSAVLWRELHRVAQQVIENLLKADSIGIHGKIRLEPLLNLDTLYHR
jgi:hypothetical protein